MVADSCPPAPKGFGAASFARRKTRQTPGVETKGWRAIRSSDQRDEQRNGGWGRNWT